MTALDLQLEARIETVLESRAADSPGTRLNTALALKTLSTLMRQYLEQPLAPDVRPLACEIASIAAVGQIDGSEEVRFRSALGTLLSAIRCQKELEATTSQFADDPETVQEFVVEAGEHLAGAEASRLSLEREPADMEALNSVFRSFHTIKGLAAILGATYRDIPAISGGSILGDGRVGLIIDVNALRYQD